MKKTSSQLKAFEDVVDRGTAAVAEVHKQISGIPFSAVEQIPTLAAPVRKVRDVHDQVIDGLYGSVRRINRAILEVAGSLVSTGGKPPADRR